MHILYIHQYFATPRGTTGTRSYEFARRWVKAGHKVTVITGHYDIGGLEYSKKPQYIEGIKVVLVGTRYSNKQSFFRRLFSFLSFVILSSCAGLRVKDIDVIYATSTPLTVGIPAMIIKFLRRKPFVFEVRDQWPEIPIELGIIRNRILIGILLRLEKRIYRSAAAIVALSPGMAEGIRSVLDCDKRIKVIPNSCDTDLFDPRIDGSEIRERYGWSDKFVFLHVGAMGRANGLDFVIDVANELRDNSQILFVLIGEGSEKSRLQTKIQQNRLSNMQVLDSIAKAELPTVFAACDASMVIFADYPILEHNSANKFFDSLSAGKPVLLNYSGWQRDILELNKAGLGCSLCNVDEFVEKARHLWEHRDEASSMGRCARKVAEDQFDRDKLAEAALGVVNSL